MLVYDISDRETFHNITQWMQQIHETLGGVSSSSGNNEIASSGADKTTSSTAHSYSHYQQQHNPHKYTYDNISILLVGNKCDVRYDDTPFVLKKPRSSMSHANSGGSINNSTSGGNVNTEDFVSYEEGYNLAQQYENVEFIEVSAKDNTNISEAFRLIAKMTKDRYVLCYQFVIFVQLCSS